MTTSRSTSRARAWPRRRPGRDDREAAVPPGVSWRRNRALGSALVRSPRTSPVAIPPVGAVLPVGTMLFGAGRLKDHPSLALFVGRIVGTYSSICAATPLLVRFTEREPMYRQIRENIAEREHGAAKPV